MPTNHSTSSFAYGSLMLIGEHSVLHGAKAVVSATQQTLHASITASDNKVDDGLVRIKSILGSYSIECDTLLEQFPLEHIFRYALASIHHCMKQLVSASLMRGFEIEYRSDIPTTVGMGSSAATVVATVKACYQFAKQPLEQHSLWQQCTAIIQQVQGRGSGADVCASVYGGVCLFHAQEGWIEKLNSRLLTELSWQLHYCGYKETTDKVLQFTHRLEQQHPQKISTIYQQMAQLTEEFIHHLEQENRHLLGATMNAYQQQMCELQVSDETLDSMIRTLQQHPSVFGAKISGSGLGDCVLSMGSLHEGGENNNAHVNVLADYNRFIVAF